MLRVQSGVEEVRTSGGEYFDKLVNKSSTAWDNFSDFKIARAGTEPFEKKVQIKKTERIAPLQSNETSTLLPKGANITGVRVFGFKKSTVKGELNHLSKLALQMVLSGIIDFIPGFFSGVLTGHLSNKLSSHLIAARSLSGIFMMITGYTVNIAIGAAMDTLCAQAYGAGKLYEMGIFFQTGIIIFAACFIPVSIISYYCVDILVLLGQPEEIAVLARSLVLWSLPNLPFGIINGLLCKILQGQNIILPMVWAGVAGMIVHNFLIWYLMFHTSVGYVASSIASSALGAIYTIALCVYFFTSHLYQKEWPGWRIRDALKEIPEFIKLGVSGLMMFIFEYWGFAAVSLFAGMLPYASVAMSADSTYSSFRVLCAIFYYSISVAGSVRVGNALGANEPDRAKVAAYTSVAFTTLCALVTSFVMAMSRDVYPYAYSEDPNVVRYAV
jgi:MATE family multidrug resistance protein